VIPLYPSPAVAPQPADHPAAPPPYAVAFRARCDTCPDVVWWTSVPKGTGIAAPAVDCPTCS
jgi:hypothetical protein